MANLYIAIGIPGSGKSTYGQKMGIKVHSSDRLRKELYGSEEIQGDAILIFNTLKHRIKEDLNKGIDCYFDATNVTLKQRMRFVSYYSKMGHTVHRLYFDVDIKTCKERNAKRDRVVPEMIIEQMQKRLDPPQDFEGWASIKIIHS